MLSRFRIHARRIEMFSPLLQTQLPKCNAHMQKRFIGGAMICAPNMPFWLVNGALERENYHTSNQKG